MNTFHGFHTINHFKNESFLYYEAVLWINFYLHRKMLMKSMMAKRTPKAMAR